MKENDKITSLPKRTLSASNYATPITNQANVANRLGETFGKYAHDRVWKSEVKDWEDVASEYVDLVFGNHYGTRWIYDAGVLGSARANHPAGRGRPNVEHSGPTPEAPISFPAYADDPDSRLDQVSGEHPSPTPLAALLRFVGGRV